MRTDKRVFWFVDAIPEEGFLSIEPSILSDTLILRELTSRQALRLERRYLKIASMTNWSGKVVRCRVQTRGGRKHPVGYVTTNYLTGINYGQVTGYSRYRN